MNNETQGDICDQANQLVELQTDLSIKNIRAQLNTGETPEYINGKRICLDCESFILEDRIKFNPHVVRCVHCQRELEREYSLYKGGYYHV